MTAPARSRRRWCREEGDPKITRWEYIYFELYIYVYFDEIIYRIDLRVFSCTATPRTRPSRWQAGKGLAALKMRWSSATQSPPRLRPDHCQMSQGTPTHCVSSIPLQVGVCALRCACNEWTTFAWWHRRFSRVLLLCAVVDCMRGCILFFLFFFGGG